MDGAEGEGDKRKALLAIICYVAMMTGLEIIIIVGHGPLSFPPRSMGWGYNIMDLTRCTTLVI